jgi:hypothetical protein
MKHFIATFDIEAAPGEPRERFMEAAVGRGWSNVLVVADQSVQLPRNTLIADFPSLEDAHGAFDAAIDDASRLMSPAKITVERRYIVERSPAGRLKTRKREWVRTNIARLNTLLKPKRAG